MGNYGSKQNIEQCLLNTQQFRRLEVGDKIDHRDEEGRFLAVKVISKWNKTLRIHYIGYGDEYDVNVNYKYGDFAIHESVSKRQASGSLSNLKKNDIVSFKPNNNCGWTYGQIIKMDRARGGQFTSGQVYVEYQTSNGQRSKRWTHLDNQYEVRAFGSAPEPKKSQQQQRGGNKSRHNNGRNHRHNHNHTHNCNNNGVYQQQNAFSGQYDNNNTMQYQSYQQKQEQRVDEVTVVTQLLVDDTNHQVQLTKDYMKAVMNQNKYTKDEITRYNQKVVVGLQCFQMKVDGMRESQEDYTDAFKSSAQIIRQFEKEFKSKYGKNESMMNRLNPCLDYMRKLLKGENVPDLPYINEYTFDKGTASRVVSAMAHAQNHVVPDRVKEINNNNNQYKDHHKQLSQQYDQSGYEEKTGDINYNGLIQDFNTNKIAFGMTTKEQDKIMQQQQNKFAFQEPDLMNGTGNDSDIDNAGSGMEVDFGDDV